MKIVSVLLMISAAGCVNHLSEVEPPKREYTSNFETPPAQQTSPGSLYSASARMRSPLSDLRAQQPGDLVTVVVEERTLAERDASTALSRDTEENARLRAFFGAFAALQAAVPEIALDPAIDADSASDFDGRGSTSRSESLRATIPCTVQKVFSNGNFLVEGHRAVLVNQDEQHLYVSGVVRPQDISAQNTIASTRLVDAHIEFSGKGSVADRQRQGWLARYLPWVWPF